MRRLFYVMFGCNAVLTLIQFFLAGPHVAIHFGADGVADSWARRETQALVMFGVELLLFMICLGISSYFQTLPKALWNLPNKDYWLDGNHTEEVKEKLKSSFENLGIAFFVFLFCVQLLVLKANVYTPPRLDEARFMIGLIIFFIYVIWWSVSFVRSFAIPGNRA